MAACTTDRVTEPYQTATEQLLVSTAVDHAIDNVNPPIARGSKVYVDAQFFDGTPGTNDVVLPRYTISAVRDLVLRAGGDLVDDRKAADEIVELRNGGQAIDHKTLMVGVPTIPVPIPLAGTIQTPEIDLFKRDNQRGISKIALTVYSQNSGALADSTGPIYGDSHDTHWTVLLLFGWDSQDVRPEDTPDKPGAKRQALK
ncbi:MAG TPA: DUF6655 family protein [Stellaceae bacterium]|nr:DUF6655 family protein [Stellaceae bacterium]